MVSSDDRLKIANIVPTLAVATNLASPTVLSRDTKFTPPLNEYIQSLLTQSYTQYITAICVPVYLLRVSEFRAKSSSSYPPHGIFIACLILATKYLHDHGYANIAWARQDDDEQFGFTINEINQMELDILKCLEWKLEISEEDLKSTWLALPWYGGVPWPFQAASWTTNDIYCKYDIDMSSKRTNGTPHPDVSGMKAIWQSPRNANSKTLIWRSSP